MSEDNTVTSTINKNVKYSKSKKIDPDDIDAEVTTYDTMLFNDIAVELALGTKKLTYSAKYGITHFSLYLIVDDEPRAKVGVFEVKTDELPSLLDEEDIVDISKGGHILTTVTESYLKKVLKSAETKKKTDSESGSAGKEKDKADAEDKDTDAEKADEDSVFRFRATPSVSMHKTKDVLRNGVFTRNPAITLPPLLEQESEADAKRWADEFTESGSNKWIEKFTKNNHYNIEENEGGGDCFFAVIRDAFRSIGQDTTVAKLRAALAKEMPEDLYATYKTLHDSVHGEIQEKKKTQLQMQNSIALLEKRRHSAKSESESKEIVAEAKRMEKQYRKIDKERRALVNNYEDFKFMKDIKSIDELREYMLRADYWIDDWGISTMERLLNIKMVILSQEMFDKNDVDSVLQCGLASEHAVENQGNYKPELYIMTSFSGDHYKLITYKHKKLLAFSEIPYSIKVLIINKCMERNSGSFYLIKDFRDLKTRLGLDPNQGSKEKSEDEVDEDFVKSDLYDKDIIFVFHKGASDKPKPGKNVTVGEQIPKSRITEFTTLETIPDWRKILDDSWICPFAVDSHRWNSVDHYVLGSQFKKGFPDTYLKFSLDSSTDISTDLDVARASISKGGLFKDKSAPDRKITVDTDFNEGGDTKRSVIERRTALEAKFQQNLDLKEALMETKLAKLVHFKRGSEGESDELLMKVRRELHR